MFWVIKHGISLTETYDGTKKHSCTDRIVSIVQPHVRPIQEGRTKAQIEFGSKLGGSLDKGLARINTFSWNTYYEGIDLIRQVESYKELAKLKKYQIKAVTGYRANHNQCFFQSKNTFFKKWS